MDACLATLVSWKVFPVFLLPFALLGLLQGFGDRGGHAREGFLIASCAPFLVFLTAGALTFALGRLAGQLLLALFD